MISVSKLIAKTYDGGNMSSSVDGLQAKQAKTLKENHFSNWCTIPNFVSLR